MYDYTSIKICMITCIKNTETQNYFAKGSSVIALVILISGDIHKMNNSSFTGP